MTLTREKKIWFHFKEFCEDVYYVKKYLWDTISQIGYHPANEETVTTEYDYEPMINSAESNFSAAINVANTAISNITSLNYQHNI